MNTILDNTLRKALITTKIKVIPGAAKKKRAKVGMRLSTTAIIAGNIDA